MSIDHADLLQKVMDKLFPDASVRGEVSAVLGRYGSAGWQPEEDRVRLAILKLAGTSPDLIRYFTMQACRDFRGILASAECPHQVANPYLMKNDPEKARELEEDDQKQYRDWYVAILWGNGEDEDGGGESPAD